MTISATTSVSSDHFHSLKVSLRTYCPDRNDTNNVRLSDGMLALQCSEITQEVKKDEG